MKRKPSKHKAVFDDLTFASHYAEKHQKMARNLGRRYTQKLKALGFEHGSILDMGCGFGGTLIYLAGQFPNAICTGIDLSDPLLNMARSESDKTGLVNHLEFKKMDAHQLNFADDSFDIVLNLNMAHLVDEPLKMLNELSRVLKPDGHYFIADLRRSWLGIFEKEIKSAFSLTEASQIIEDSDLIGGYFYKDMLWWYCQNLKE